MMVHIYIVVVLVCSSVLITADSTTDTNTSCASNTTATSTELAVAATNAGSELNDKQKNVSQDQLSEKPANDGNSTKELVVPRISPSKKVDEDGFEELGDLEQAIEKIEKAEFKVEQQEEKKSIIPHLCNCEGLTSCTCCISTLLQGFILKTTNCFKIDVNFDNLQLHIEIVVNNITVKSETLPALKDPEICLGTIQTAKICFHVYNVRLSVLKAKFQVCSHADLYLFGRLTKRVYFGCIRRSALSLPIYFREPNPEAHEREFHKEQPDSFR